MGNDENGESSPSRGFKFRWHKKLMRSELKPNIKAVGAYMFDWAKPDGSESRPGRTAIARDMRMSKATVDRALKELREHEWLVRTASGSNTGTRNMADVYRLTIPNQSSPTKTGAVGTSDDTHQSSTHANQSSNETNQSSIQGRPVLTGDDLTDHQHINTQQINTQQMGGRELASDTTARTARDTCQKEEHEHGQYERCSTHFGRCAYCPNPMSLVERETNRWDECETCEETRMDEDDEDGFF